jgi:hypothetical protein
VEFLPLVGSLIVAGVAYFAIHANNSRADRRDDKSWYRKLLVENSVAFMGKMDDALAAIADSHEAYVDMENDVSDREWNERAVQKLRLSIGELRSAALLVKMSCSTETATSVDKVVASFEEALDRLSTKFRFSDYATEPGTEQFEEFEKASREYQIYGDQLAAMKPRVLARFKADIAEGGFTDARKISSGQLKNVEGSNTLHQITRG